MKAHRLDPISLVAGALFTLLGVVGASGSLASIEDLRVIGPMALLVAGMLLVSSALGGVRDPRLHDAHDQELGPSPADAPTDAGVDDPVADWHDADDPVDRDD